MDERRPLLESRSINHVQTNPSSATPVLLCIVRQYIISYQLIVSSINLGYAIYSPVCKKNYYNKLHTRQVSLGKDSSPDIFLNRMNFFGNFFNFLGSLVEVVKTTNVVSNHKLGFGI